jgi:hypothetical protein
MKPSSYLSFTSLSQLKSADCSLTIQYILEDRICPEVSKDNLADFFVARANKLRPPPFTIPVRAYAERQRLIECKIAVWGIEEDVGSPSLSSKEVEPRRIVSEPGQSAGSRHYFDRLPEFLNDRHVSHVTPEFAYISGNRHLWDGECFDEAASWAKRHDGTGLGPYSKEPRLSPDDDDDDDCFGFRRSGIPTYDANYKGCGHRAATPLSGINIAIPA